MLALNVARQASRSCPLRGEPLGVEELVSRHVHAPQRLLRRVELFEHGHLVAAHEALPQNLAPGLIMTGDVNGLGMEPAAISGIYAANKIIGKTID